MDKINETIETIRESVRGLLKQKDKEIVTLRDVCAIQSRQIEQLFDLIEQYKKAELEAESELMERKINSIEENLSAVADTLKEHLKM